MNRPLVAEILAIGDELTSGQRLDTNTKWLSERLTEIGVEVRYHTTVGDNLDANVEVFRAAASRADVVVATGGLGPTADDLTREAMGAAAGVSLVEDPAMVAHIEELFRSRGREMPPQNRRQGEFPSGANPIPNAQGTAPGIDLTTESGCRWFALPGVPAEMRPMWSETVGPAIREMGPARVTRHYLVRTFGAGESQIESMLPEMIARQREPLVGITASTATITLRVSCSGSDTAACDELAAPTLAEIRETLGELVFSESTGGEPEPELHEVVVEELIRRGTTVASRESMTRGLLAQWLAEADAGRGAVRGATFGPPEADVTGEADSDYRLLIGEEADECVEVELLDHSGGVAKKSIRLTGRVWLDGPLVAKHALNLLRLELAKTGGERE